ncbi:MAG: DUF4124 domain-containing protein [Thiohalophilus sp.]|uniref:DUF4124 domain-containing protein n=1 Tax=Thiohalophilus sp. TaxID=3028392 RepID=UPI00287003A8|nr:DUF4124 domain-containing protein [Thiohalophilus sp.]MDR9436999.1 DUF4124 domain-containing protein [Thiohalophilus sp.]
MKRKIQQLVSGLLLASLLSVSMAADVYKWTDEQGRVHYGDKPPEKGAQSMDVDPGESSGSPIPGDAERREKTRRLLRAYEEERRIKQQREQRQQAQAAERRKRCAWARDRLRRYQQAGRLYDLDEQGNRKILGDSQRQQAEARAAQEVRQWCD